MKILIVICTGFVPWGGLTTVAMNYYRAMDKQGMIIDFASNNQATEVLLDELNKNGSRYIQLPKRENCLKYIQKLYKVLKDGYDIIHIHGNSATMSLELFPALLCGTPKRIVHCHTTKPTAKYLSYFLCPIFKKMYTYAIAVSYEAGEWLYGKDNFCILNNAINIRKYFFNFAKRKQVRNNIGINEETFVVGHVGKINIQKNHKFIIEIFEEIVKRKENSLLLLVGDGPLRKATEEKVEEKGLQEKVIFVGMSEEPELWLNAMDCFLFPSKFEGFGLALAEAQANGLTCFAADSVPKCVDVAQAIHFISLNTKPAEWAEKIINEKHSRMDIEHIVEMFDRAGLNIESEANKLKKLYET